MRRLLLVLIALLVLAPRPGLAQISEPLPAPPPSEAPPPEVAPPYVTPPEGAPAHAPVHHKKRTTKKHRKHHKPVEPEVETTVEPATARLKVQTPGAPIYARASRRSERIGTLGGDMFVQVTGSTKSYLQVQLKDGRVGYIEPSSVDLVKPYDKQFLLTADSPVYSVPNQWGQKLAEVHRGRYIHVIGQALGYLKIRMKDGTQGYVPMTAAQ